MTDNLVLSSGKDCDQYDLKEERIFSYLTKKALNVDLKMVGVDEFLTAKNTNLTCLDILSLNRNSCQKLLYLGEPDYI